MAEEISQKLDQKTKRQKTGQEISLKIVFH